MPLAARPPRITACARRPHPSRLAEIFRLCDAKMPKPKARARARFTPASGSTCAGRRGNRSEWRRAGAHRPRRASAPPPPTRPNSLAAAAPSRAPSRASSRTNRTAPLPASHTTSASAGSARGGAHGSGPRASMRQLLLVIKRRDPYAPRHH